MPDITSLSLVTGTEQTRQAFVEQLKNIFLRIYLLKILN